MIIHVRSWAERAPLSLITAVSWPAALLYMGVREAEVHLHVAFEEGVLLRFLPQKEEEEEGG